MVKFDGVPIVIGVTGHRAIPPDAEPMLRAKFAEILDRYAKRYPASTPAVLSGLAAGADLLAAEVAFEHNVPVIACLPAPQSEYERDFSEEERERFRTALSRCTATIVIGNATSPEQGYANLGSFLVYYSAVIVAFWDGNAGRGAGGTADVVHMRETTGDLGPVLQIVTPRTGEDAPSDAFSIREMYGQRPSVDLQIKKKRRRSAAPVVDEGQVEFESGLQNLDRFNRDIAAERTAPSGAASLAAFRIAADRAADRLQKWTLQSLRWLYVIGGIAIAAQLVVQQPLTQISSAATGIRFGLLAVAGLWFKFAKRQDYENRYQDYRAIAEALRVQEAWCSAGLRDRLVEASYLQMQQSELRWIRLALRSIYLISGGRDACESDSLSHADCAAWVDGQHAYYEKASRVQVHAQQRIFRVSSALMGIGGAISGIAVVASVLRGGVGPFALHLGTIHLSLLTQKWSLYSAFPGLHAVGNLSQWLLYFMTVPASLVGMVVLLLQFYAQQRGYAENARRYQRMFEVFDLAARRLAEPGADRAQLLTALGHEALSEHADWLILHRERPMRVISGLTHVQAAPHSQR